MSILLKELPHLVLDIQATTANPATGVPFEIGFVPFNSPRIRAAEPRVFMVTQEEDFEVPRAVQRITGLKSEDFEKSEPLEHIWKELVEAARVITEQHSLSLCPLVIHYARYELAYLNHFQNTFGRGNDFPFRVICTHQISKRLFPRLPRKGLRAIAGYLGYSASQLRRCAHHLDATVFIWEHITRLLEQQEGITTLDELLLFLEEPVSGKKKKTDRASTGRKYPMDSSYLENLPDTPGVYFMQRVNGDIIYVGKAGSLKKRVRSYFRARQKHSEHILEMLAQAQKLFFKNTGSALEACLTESDQIKKLCPPYNVALRPEGRQILYCSPDFSSCVPMEKGEPGNSGEDGKYEKDEKDGEGDKKREKDETARLLGPFPGPFFIVSFQTLVRQLMEAENRLPDEQLIQPLFQGPGEYHPSLEIFREGWNLFCDRYTFLQAQPGLPGLTGRLKELAGRLWREKLAAPAEGETHNEDETDEEGIGEEPPEEFEWTGEHVLHRLESIIKYGFYYMRRARWYSLLADSVVCWQKKAQKKVPKKHAKKTDPSKTNAPAEDALLKESPDELTKELTKVPLEYNILYFRDGAVYKKEQAAEPPDPPDVTLPPGHGSFFIFDIAGYDRMRILTTELRRILHEGREVKLLVCRSFLKGTNQNRIRSGWRVIGRDRLETLLRWV